MAASPSPAARAAVAELLAEAAADAWREAPGGGSPGEIAFLRSIFRHVVRGLDAALAPALAGFDWASQTRGIFVHGRPFVAFDPARSPGGCELGDLLIVLHNVGDQAKGNALLLQAKLGTPPLAFAGTSERRQWRLYRAWPEFWWRHRFVHHGLGDDGRRHVTPAAPHPGAQYLAIEPRPRSGASFRVAATDDAHKAGATQVADFADAIVDTVLRSCGRGFADREVALGRIGWDRVIWDLLESWAHTRPALRASRYHGFDAFRVGETPPDMLRAVMAARETEALWSGLPELPQQTGEPPSPEEPQIEEPPLISTIFIALSPTQER